MKMFSYINNLSIRNKLISLTFLPLIGFICFAGYEFVKTYNEEASLKEMLILTDSASASSMLVHELQKERGTSAGYLSSKGEKFALQVKQYRTITDQKITHLQKFIQNNNLTPKLTSLFSQVDQQLNKLTEIRRQIDNFSISVNDEVAFYSNINRLLLSIIDNTANENNNSELAIAAISIGSFLQFKERAGIERAVLSNVFAQDSFTPGSLEKFIRLMAEQEAYFTKFKAHATKQQWGIYQKHADTKIFTAVQRYRDIALNKMQNGGFNQDPTVWFAAMTQKINQLKSIEVELLAQLHNVNLNLINQNNKTLISLAAGVLLPFSLVVFFCFFVAIQLNKSIHEITHKLQLLTKNNDLTIRIKSNSKDELGQISQTVNQLVEHLQGIVGKIHKTSESLQENLAENIKNNQIIESNINNGNDQVTQVVTSTTEMSQTVSSIACDAVQVSTAMDEASQQSQQGDQIVSRTITNINHLSTELDNVSNVVNKLNDSAFNIGKFLKVINEISEKTNLLALNAAIEAARAGEYGRGFAVVADEVRSLSKQTQQSTKEIELMINELQTGSLAAQDAMKNGIDMVAKSVNDAQKTGENITYISECIQKIHQMNLQIATATEEQSIVTETINENMLHMQKGYGHMQGSYYNLEQCSQLIGTLATELNETVKEFKVV